MMKIVYFVTQSISSFLSCFQVNFRARKSKIDSRYALPLDQGSQTHLGVRATLQDITQSVGRIVFRDNKMQ